MKLYSLSLCNFRNYKKTSLYFTEGVQGFYGANAQGKTNLLEAAAFLISARSFRTHRLNHLIHKGEASCFLEARVESGGVEQVIGASLSQGQRTLFLNGRKVASRLSLLGLVHGVVFGPHDAWLIRGDPAQRRLFLDLQLSQSDPLYVHHLNRYYRALQQRNALLKTGATQGYSPFEQLMASSADYLIRQRRELTLALEAEASELYGELSGGGEGLSLRYQTQNQGQGEELGTQEGFLRLLETSREKDRRLKYSTVGPHRDDVWIGLDQRETRTFGSEGQVRCCAAALRIAEWRCLRNRKGEDPLFFADDCLLGLDRGRARRLSQLLLSMGQVFVTAPEREELLWGLGSTTCLSEVKDGEVLPSPVPNTC